MDAVARVMEYGARKYGMCNWARGGDTRRYVDAAIRHLMAYANGEDDDQESGLSHLAHAACNLGFLLHFRAHNKGTDGRQKIR